MILQLRSSSAQLPWIKHENSVGGSSIHLWRNYVSMTFCISARQFALAPSMSSMSSWMTSSKYFLYCTEWLLLDRYGGHVTDAFDRRLVMAYLENYLYQELLDGFQAYAHDMQTISYKNGRKTTQTILQIMNRKTFCNFFTLEWQIYPGFGTPSNTLNRKQTMEYVTEAMPQVKTSNYEHLRVVMTDIARVLCNCVLHDGRSRQSPMACIQTQKSGTDSHRYLK